MCGRGKYFMTILSVFQVKRDCVMAKTISLFNQKGGVSKTTTTFNLAWVLAEGGARVLMVDLDPQCNLTGLVLGYNAIDDDSMERFYESRGNLTMKPIVSSLIDGVSPEQFVEQDKGEVFKTVHDNLFLLPGHLDTADMDSQISVSLKIASGIPATRNIPSSLPKTLQLISNSKEIDYTIYDLSPSIGGLNEVALMSSNYFIIPTSPDYFCLQAISSLSRTIIKWHNDIEIFKRANNFENKNYAIKNTPKFIGTIQQRYRPRYDKPGKSFQSWIDLIRHSINSKLVPSLYEINCIVPEDDFKSAIKDSELEPYDLAHIADFNSLIAISQQLSKPIFALTDEDLHKTGKVFGHAMETMIESRDKFAKLFNELGERVRLLTA